MDGGLDQELRYDFDRFWTHKYHRHIRDRNFQDGTTAERAVIGFLTAIAGVETSGFNLVLGRYHSSGDAKRRGKSVSVSSVNKGLG